MLPFDANLWPHCNTFIESHKSSHLNIIDHHAAVSLGCAHDRTSPRRRYRPPPAPVHGHAAQGTRSDRPDTTVLDLTLANYAEVGITDVAIVVGYAADAIEARVAGFAGAVRRHARTGAQRQGGDVEQRVLAVVCARPARAQGAMLANGDTVHPVSVQQRPARRARRRSSADPRAGHREVARGRGDEGDLVAGARRRADHQADGPGDRDGRVHRRHADRTVGCRLRWPPPCGRPGNATPTCTTKTAINSSPTRTSGSTWRPIGTVDWVEIDNHADLARARRSSARVACRC